MKLNIAIDGPSAAGKSTIARRLAHECGYIHLDTGAMYRCIAYKALNEKLALDEEAALGAMIDRTEIRLTPQGQVFLDGVEMRDEIRRFLETQQQGISADYDQLVAEIAQRDRQDMERVHSPLRQAEDAIRVDTSDMTIDEVVATIKQIMAQKSKEGNHD